MTMQTFSDLRNEDYGEVAIKVGLYRALPDAGFHISEREMAIIHAALRIAARVTMPGWIEDEMWSLFHASEGAGVRSIDADAEVLLTALTKPD